MRIKNLLTAMCLCFGFAAGAQTLGVKVELSPADAENGMKVFMRPVSGDTPESAVELVRDGDTRFYSGNVSADPDGIYNLYCQTQSFQSSVPLYVAPGTKDADFSIRLNDYIPQTSLTDNVNAAISAYNGLVAANSRKIGKTLKDMDDAEIKALLGSYMSRADSIVAMDDIPAGVKEFIRIWGYTSASDALGMAKFFAGRMDKKVDIDAADILPPAEKSLDTRLALAFPTSNLIVVSSLPKGEIEERMEELYKLYSTPEIRDRAASALVSSWMDSFDYGNRFDEGEKRLEALTAKYSLPEEYLSTYRARRSTIVGAPFPDVELLDRDGNKVDFSKFRGKYVYVDLWASWCGPCCREVPYLQKMEEALKDSNVTFVSISTDSGTPQWIKKMDQLNMHGNQLIDIGGTITQKLNVRGIPRFLIYDPEGKLYMDDAPRPSHKQTIHLLEGLK